MSFNFYNTVIFSIETIEQVISKTLNKFFMDIPADILRSLRPKL